MQIPTQIYNKFDFILYRNDINDEYEINDIKCNVTKVVDDTVDNTLDTMVNEEVDEEYDYIPDKKEELCLIQNKTYSYTYYFMGLLIFCLCIMGIMNIIQIMRAQKKR